MFNLRSFLVLLFLCGVQSVQEKTKVAERTILQQYTNFIVFKNCDIAWVKPEKVGFLNSCNIFQTYPTAITTNTSLEYQCTVYFDLNSRLCTEISKDKAFKDKMPYTKQDIEDILKNLDSPDIANDFCNATHNDILKLSANISKTKQYVEEFANAMSNPLQCKLACFDFDSKLHPICKSILWITNMLNSHLDNISTVNRINQYKLKLQNTTAQQISDMTSKQISGNDTNKPKMFTNSSPVKDSLVESLTNIKSEKDNVIVPELSIGSNNSTSIKNNLTSSEFNKSIGLSSEKAIDVQLSKEAEKLSGARQAPNKTAELEKASSVVPSPVNIPVVEDADALDRPNISPDDEDDDVGVDDTKLDNELLDDDIHDIQLQNKPLQPDRSGPESASGVAGGAAPAENPTNDASNDKVTLTGKFEDAEDTHFFPYFLFISGVLICGYILFHNKNKVLGLLLEGRRNDSRRRCPAGGPAYRKLDCTLEEVVNSAPPSHNPHIVY